MIAACSGIKIDVKQGQNITVIDIEGGQVVDFFAEVTGCPNEFLSTGVTIDCNESLKLKIGDIIYTNLYQPMMKVLSDDVGEHDLFHPVADQKCMISSIIMAKDTQTVSIISIMPLKNSGPLLRLSIYLCTRKSILTVVFQWKRLFPKPGIK